MCLLNGFFFRQYKKIIRNSDKSQGVATLTDGDKVQLWNVGASKRSGKYASYYPGKWFKDSRRCLLDRPHVKQ